MEDIIARTNLNDPDAQDGLWIELVKKHFYFPSGQFSKVDGSKFAVSFEQQNKLFHRIYDKRGPSHGLPQVWTPDRNTIRQSNILSFARRAGIVPRDYDPAPGQEATNFVRKMHKWSVDNRAEFWKQVFEQMNIQFTKPPTTGSILSTKGKSSVIDPNWFDGAELNIVDSCFQAPSSAKAIVYSSEDDQTVRHWTYGQLEKMVNRVSNGLIKFRCSPNESIGIYMPMNPECIAAYLAVVKMGAVVTSIADSFQPAEIANRMAITNTQVVFTVDRYIRGGKPMNMYENMLKAISILGKTKDIPNAPKNVRVVVVSLSGPSDPPAKLRPGDIFFHDLIAKQSDKFESFKGRPIRLTNFIFSSGTTGNPKIIPWTHLTPVKAASDGFFYQDIHPGDVVCWFTNVGWMMGPWVIYASLMNKASMALWNGAPFGKTFGDFISRSNTTLLGVIPSIVKTWYTSRCMEKCDWRKIRTFSSTGECSNIHESLYLMGLARYRAPVIEYCGGTEIGGAYITGTVLQPCSPTAFTTAAFGFSFHVLGPDNKPAKRGEQGEVYIVPPAIGISQRLMNADHYKVYYAGCPSGPNGEVLRRHGDQMLVLWRGYYRALGRSDDSMKLGGIKVSSAEIERCCIEHPSIVEVAAISVPPHGGGAEALVLFLVKKPDCDTKAPHTKLMRELQQLVSKNLSPLFKISHIEVVPMLPKTSTNKIMRREIRAEFLKRRDSAVPRARF